MADTKTSDLTALETVALTDVLPIVDITGGTITKKVTVEDLLAPATDAIPTALADLSDDATHRVVTDVEKAKWNGLPLGFAITKPADTIPTSLRIPLITKTKADLTFDNLEVACDANPTTEITGDIKYASDPITLAGATVINDFDTTDGKRSDSSITTGAVPAGSFVYLQFDELPEAALEWISYYLNYTYDEA